MTDHGTQTIRREYVSADEVTVDTFRDNDDTPAFVLKFPGYRILIEGDIDGLIRRMRAAADRA